MSNNNGSTHPYPPLPFAAPTYLEAFQRMLEARTPAQRAHAEEDMGKVFPWLLAEHECERLLTARRRGRAGLARLRRIVALHE